MGFEDRDYYRDGSGDRGFLGNVGHWLVYGRVSLFRAFGIHVQAHSSLLIAMALMLLLRPPTYTWQDQVISALLLFLIVMLHEFGHCFGCRAVGGDADEIVMHPLGGLALTRPPATWRAHLVTVVAGPAVNVVFCLVCGLTLYFWTGQVPWKPFVIPADFQFRGWLEPTWLLFWLYQTNQALLAFNLLPIFPLDGGQIVQSLLWPFTGYYRSMLISCVVGMAGAVVFGLIGIATGALFLLILCILGFMHCMRMRQMLREVGPYGFSEYDDPFARSLSQTSRADARDAKKARALADRQAKEAERRRQEREAESAEIDRILAKVSASGMHSLSKAEQRTLKEATARQNKQDAARR